MLKAFSHAELTIGPKTDSSTELPRYERRWRSKNGTRLLTWDSLHGEIEVFNLRGKHLEVLDAISGKPCKGAIRGRRIDV
jgi:hypothetical protein